MKSTETTTTTALRCVRVCVECISYLRYTPDKFVHRELGQLVAAFREQGTNVDQRGQVVLVHG